MKARKKNVVKMLSICLAFLLAAGSILTVFAGESGREEKNTAGLTVYLDTAKGDDENDGLTKETPLKTWKAVQKYFEQKDEEKQDAETSGTAGGASDEDADEEKIVVLCGKTVLSDVQKKTLDDDGITAMTETEYTEYLEGKDEIPIPSPVPAPGDEEKDDSAVTPTPTPGEDEEDDAAVTPTPTPGEDEDGEAAVTPTPTPGGDEEDSEAVTPTPTPGEDEESDAAVTPTPTPGEDEEGEAAVTPVPTPGGDEEDGEAVTPTPTPGEDEENDAAVTPTPTPGEEKKDDVTETPAPGGAEKDGTASQEEQALNEIQMLSLLPADSGDDQNDGSAVGDDVASEELQTADASEENRLLAAAESSRTVTRTEVPETRKLPGTDLVGGGTSSAGPSGGSGSGSSSSGSGSASGTGSSGSSQTGSSGQTQTGTNASHSLTPQKPAPVKTGDLTQMYPLMISLCMSGFLCVVLFRAMLEKKRNVSRAGYREELGKFRKDCEIK